MGSVTVPADRPDQVAVALAGDLGALVGDAGVHDRVARRGRGTGRRAGGRASPALGLVVRRWHRSTVGAQRDPASTAAGTCWRCTGWSGAAGTPTPRSPGPPRTGWTRRAPAPCRRRPVRLRGGAADGTRGDPDSPVRRDGYLRPEAAGGGWLRRPERMRALGRRGPGGRAAAAAGAGRHRAGAGGAAPPTPSRPPRCSASSWRRTACRSTARRGAA